MSLLILAPREVGPLLFGSPSSLLFVFATLLVAYFVGHAVYAITFHPLAKFPGPVFAAISGIPWWKAALAGNQVSWMLELHQRYGDVVRLGPNSISYADARAWKDVQGLGSGKVKSRKENPKAKEIDLPPKNGVENILVADLEPHRRLRRLFAPAFSERAVRSQEALLLRYADLMATKLGEACDRSEQGTATLDMAQIYAFATFDIMGDLLLGQPLGLLENTRFSPWVQAVFDSVKIIPMVMMMRAYPILWRTFKMLQPKWMSDMETAHFRHTADRVDARMKKGSDQPDIWNLVTEGLTVEEMHSNADLLMLAGTETTGTLLAGLIYYVATHPEILKRLTREIRTTFQHSSEIDMTRLASAKYLNACLQEALRMYPPVPTGIPRVVPDGGQMILDVYVPAETRISVHHSATYRSPKNFFNPNTFDPERWLPPTAADALASYPYKDDKREACQPFSYGPRDCIGQKLAWYEMRLLAAKLLYSFDLELCEESQRWRYQKVYSLWEKKPLMCRLRRKEVD